MLGYYGQYWLQQWSNFEKVSIALADLNRRHFTFRNKYRDTWHVAIGAEWYYDPDLTISGGIAYDSSAISDTHRPLDFPIGEQWRFGTGVRWNISQNLAFDFSSELQWQGNLKSDVSRGANIGRVSGVFKETYAIFINSNLTYVF